MTSITTQINQTILEREQIKLAEAQRRAKEKQERDRRDALNLDTKEKRDLRKALKNMEQDLHDAETYLQEVVCRPRGVPRWIPVIGTGCSRAIWPISVSVPANVKPGDDLSLEDQSFFWKWPDLIFRESHDYRDRFNAEFEGVLKSAGYPVCKLVYDHQTSVFKRIAAMFMPRQIDVDGVPVNISMSVAYPHRNEEEFQDEYGLWFPTLGLRGARLLAKITQRNEDLRVNLGLREQEEIAAIQKVRPVS